MHRYERPLGVDCPCHQRNWYRYPKLSCPRIGLYLPTTLYNTAFVDCEQATEVSDHTSRGNTIATEFTSNIFGVVIAYWLNYGLSFIDGGNSPIRWRFPIAFQILPLLGLIGAVFFFPESPRWLAKAGKMEEARYVLWKIRGCDLDKTDIEMEEIKEAVIAEKNFKHKNGVTNSWTMAFGLGKGRMHITRRVYLIIALQVIQEWVGVAGVTVYAPVMFRAAGFSSQKANLICGINTVGRSLSAQEKRQANRYDRSSTLSVHSFPSGA
jgi:MFS family permease